MTIKIFFSAYLVIDICYLYTHMLIECAMYIYYPCTQLCSYDTVLFLLPMQLGISFVMVTEYYAPNTPIIDTNTHEVNACT